MRFSELVRGLGSICGGTDGDVSAVVADSRLAGQGALFVAVRGVGKDGHTFVADAIARGASFAVIEDAQCIPAGFCGGVAKVADGRKALGELASRFHVYPSRELFCVGVTGTDGKSTTTWMTEAVLGRGNLPTGVIGNIDHHFADACWPTAVDGHATTPDPLTMQARLRQFRSLGARAVAMEVSSHALSQGRVDAVAFDVCVITNMMRDRLDYHGSAERYFAAKERLFTEVLAGTRKTPCWAVVNVK
jgi:UDP-N-acetylmuramoyl-L-alanyl-D-glutamate--2,6-diaminopimelate ligase